MLRRSVVLFFFLGLACPVFGGDIAIIATDATITGFGGSTQVAIQSTAPIALSGFSYGLCEPNAALAIDGMPVAGADLAATNGGAGPDFFAPAVDPDPGGPGEHTVGCVVSFAGMSELPAGDLELALATYTDVAGVETDCGSGGGHPLAFCDTLGTPLVITTFVDTGGGGIAPAFDDGCVTVLDVAPFKFLAPTTDLTYPVMDPTSATATVTLNIVDAFNSATGAQGFSFGINIGSEVTLTGSSATGALAATNGGVGPDFFGNNDAPVNGPGFTVGVVVSFSGMDTLTSAGPPDGSAVVALDIQANPSNPGPGNTGDAPLTWGDNLGDPAVINTVVVEGVGQNTLFCDGNIRLIGVEDVEFLRGDCNDDGIVDIADGINTINEYVSGEGPPLGDCVEACDSNDDDMGPDISDASYIFNWQFLGGPPPPAPFPDCGTDPDTDCNSYANCP